MPTIFVAYTFLAMTLLAFPGQTPASTQKIVRVFVETSDLGEGDELADRRTSVRDLVAALGAKKKMFAVVDDEAKADVAIEVIQRAYVVPKVVLGIGARPGQSTIGATPVRTAELRVRATVTATTLSVAFKNKNKPADHPRGWRSAADDVADQIAKWVEQRERSSKVN